MDLATLRKDHPELVRAIADEATADMDEKLAQAKKDGGDEALSNINAKRSALSGLGHDELAEELAFNPEITEEMAVRRMLEAVKEEKKEHFAEFQKDAPKPAKQPANDKPDEDLSSGPMTEEKARKAWDKDGGLRAEFAGDFDVYLAYVSEQDGVKIKTLNDRGDK